MVWRKWLIRGLVLCVLGALAAGGGLYALWTNPAMIRQLVQEKLGVRFVRVAVQIGSARLRLLGGIQVSDVRLARSDGVGNGDFLYVPSGVIYHDKEQMLDGKVAIRQVELHQPQLRIIRERDGRVNLAGILGPLNLKERLPTVVIRDGTVIFEDRTLRDPSPLIEVRHVAITMINDPLPTLRLEGEGQAELLGPVRFKATVARATMATAVDLELPAIPVGGDLLDRVSRLVPALAGRHGQLVGRASISGQVSHPGEAGGPIGHDLTLHLRNGRLRHEWLPGTVEGIDLTVRLTDGKIPEARLTAASGPARLEARLEDVTLAAVPPDLEALESLVAAADLRVVRYPVSDEALGFLPADLQFVRAEFAPAGPLNVSYRYRRAAAGNPRIRAWTFQAEGMTGLFVDFPYPVRNVRGTMTVDTSASPLRNIHLDLTGLAGEAPVSLRGHIRGEKKTAEVHLDIHGREVLLDQHVYQALPPRVQRVARQFLPQQSRVRGLATCPMGRADVEATIRRAGTDRAGQALHRAVQGRVGPLRPVPLSAGERLGGSGGPSRPLGVQGLPRLPWRRRDRRRCPVGAAGRRTAGPGGDRPVPRRARPRAHLRPRYPAGSRIREGPGPHQRRRAPGAANRLETAAAGRSLPFQRRGGR